MSDQAEKYLQIIKRTATFLKILHFNSRIIFCHNRYYV